jgi:glycine cleavage system H protein
MEGFTYNDIFETKGIEYLVIIAFLILLIPFWFLLNRSSKIKAGIQNAINVFTANVIKIPQGLFYNKNHTWAHLEQSGLAKVGLDDFLLKVVGGVRISNLKSPGEKIKKGDLLAEVTQNDKRLLIYSPISGEIEYSNQNIIEDPGILNQDPYEQGWIYRIKPSDWVAEMQTCYLADEATRWFRKEFDRFKDFLQVSFGKYSSEPSMVVFQEGGEMRNNPLAELDDDIWKDFQKEFLNT